MKEVLRFYGQDFEVGSQRICLHEAWERFGAVADSTTPAISSAEYRTFIVDLIATLNPAKRILSVGCGNAFVEVELLRAGYHVAAIDVISEAVNLALSKGILASTRDFFSLSSSDVRGYEIIYLDGLLGHLFDGVSKFDDFLQHCRNLGKSSPAWLISSFDESLGLGEYAANPHVSGFFWFKSAYFVETLEDWGYCNTRNLSFVYRRPQSGWRERRIVVSNFPPFRDGR